ncbi:hypothetical protein PIB30_000729 [Stylosanthes scabra]|uniref:F-box domain-containing protein n=1 Tax=Stylosanthes scabra TaxID=79078 RepID=A0ABU6Z4K6_9FABA|nr:hypothetical protein [Stylosanthes scabra]
MEKQKSMDDLPVELIQKIFLMVPAKQLGRLRCVSKLWQSLISDPHFAHSHFNLHSSTPSPSCLFVKAYTEAYFVHLDPLINVSSESASVTEISLPFKKKKASDFSLMGCCRGFVLLNQQRHFLVVWNPLTGSSKRISYSHIASRSKIPGFMFPTDAILYGFGYDDSQDDYLVVLAWLDNSTQQHLDCFSLRANSWISLDSALSALPKPSVPCYWESCGLFLNGAIHWLSFPLRSYIDAILVFDLKERSFSKISIPEQIVRCSTNLIVLGECLALVIRENHKSYIWVMKEYKVQSSWTLMYEIPYCNSEALCLSNGFGSDIILLEYDDKHIQMRFAKYNASGELLQHFSHPSICCYSRNCLGKFYFMYTESLLPFPSDLRDKDKKKKKKTGHRVRKNVSNNLRLLKIRITRGSNEENESGTSIHVR